MQNLKKAQRIFLFKPKTLQKNCDMRCSISSFNPEVSLKIQRFHP